VCASQAQADALTSTLAARYPDAALSGTIVPPVAESWPDDFTHDAVRAVGSSGARIVWVGVSAPKQEIWAIQAAESLTAPVVCVGAALDFLTQTKPRAPVLMRRLGLEWLFRLVAEPRRLWHRYLVGNTVYLWDLVTIPPRIEPE
jgi:N-acetylglucosaminyldiphosphoundecaprenol N-acetyl-beta-D-mannosaminyltransferase